MGNIDINQKIQQVIDTFGMKDDIVAKAMNVTVQTIRNKRNEKAIRHSFNEKNYTNLIAYIKKEAEKL